MSNDNAAQQSVALRQIAVDAPDYQHYRPLNAERREIRVLDLESPATCTLRHVSLDGNPIYYALSYCWGPPTSTRPLTIKQVDTTDVQIVHLRRTVASFLKNVFKCFGRISIWLDVICINQRSFIEQSTQVAMMGDIYRQARGVYAWMGKWDPDIDFLFLHCKEIPSTAAVRAIGSDCALSIELLACRPYWSRLWVIQECALNRNLLLVCGDRAIQWERFYGVLQKLELQLNDLHTRLLRCDARSLDHFKHIQSLRNAPARGPGTGASLLHLVLSFSHSNCSDVRDKVYGLRALAPNGTDLQVDYSTTVLDTFINLISFHNIACAQDQVSSRHDWWTAGYDAPDIFAAGRELAIILGLGDAAWEAMVYDQAHDWLLVPLHQTDAKFSPVYHFDPTATRSYCAAHAVSGRNTCRRIYRFSLHSDRYCLLEGLDVLGCGRIVAVKLKRNLVDFVSFDWRGHLWVCRYSLALHMTRAFYMYSIGLTTLGLESYAATVARWSASVGSSARRRGMGTSCHCRTRFKAARPPPWTSIESPKSDWHD